VSSTRRLTTRASDADRASVERALRHHYATGRLDEVELERRLDAVHRAGSVAETRRLLRDLPKPRRPSRWMIRVHRGMVRLHVAGYAAYNGGFIGLWALDGGGTFWPAVPLVGGGALLAWHAYGVPAAVRKFYEEG
jgi:hypothetical protein